MRSYLEARKQGWAGLASGNEAPFPEKSPARRSLPTTTGSVRELWSDLPERLLRVDPPFIRTL